MCLARGFHSIANNFSPILPPSTSSPNSPCWEVVHGQGMGTGRAHITAQCWGCPWLPGCSLIPQPLSLQSIITYGLQQPLHHPPLPLSPCQPPAHSWFPVPCWGWGQPGSDPTHSHSVRLPRRRGQARSADRGCKLSGPVKHLMILNLSASINT